MYEQEPGSSLGYVSEYNELSISFSSSSPSKKYPSYLSHNNFSYDIYIVVDKGKPLCMYGQEPGSSLGYVSEYNEISMSLISSSSYSTLH